MRVKPSRYLCRVWRSGEQPPVLSPTDISWPEGQHEARSASDKAMTAAVTGWAARSAQVEGVPYAYEVRRAGRSGEVVAEGVVQPGAAQVDASQPGIAGEFPGSTPSGQTVPRAGENHGRRGSNPLPRTGSTD